jgi:thioredoxin-like negative regulator of GroEL
MQSEVIMAAITLTEANFDREVGQSALPVIVGFGDSDNLDDVSRHLKGSLKFCKVNCVTAPSLAKRYKIHNTPTMLVFKGGRVTDTIVGALKPEQLLKILQ